MPRWRDPRSAARLGLGSHGRSAYASTTANPWCYSELPKDLTQSRRRDRRMACRSITDTAVAKLAKGLGGATGLLLICGRCVGCF